MRFKPRTDLERVFDVVNQYNYGTANRQIIKNQLKKLELSGPQQDKRTSNEDESSFNSFNKSKELTNLKDTNVDETETSFNVKRVKRRIVDNSEAKEILKDLYIKTHFKAASVYTILKSNLC